MGNLGIRITCKRCGNKAPISDMKYNVDGKSLICSACYAKQHGRGAIKEEKKMRRDEKIEPKKKITDSYICLRCNYKFRLVRDSGLSLKCPYCGKDDKVQAEIAPDANELIRDSVGFE